MTLREYAKKLKDSGMGCNCDLDNWEPERSTGHSHVCRIHKKAIHDARYSPKELESTDA